jgi:hypothetical protein
MLYVIDIFIYKERCDWLTDGKTWNEERCDKGPGQVTRQATQTAEGLAVSLKQPYE